MADFIACFNFHKEAAQGVWINGRVLMGFEMLKQNLKCSQDEEYFTVWMKIPSLNMAE